MDNSFLVRLGLDTEEISAGIKKSNVLIEDFTNQVKGLGSVFAEAFAVKEIVNFGIEVSELASKANGIEQAFARIPNSTALLSQMNEATHETVSNLELMKEAIKAENLQIPMDKLGTIMEFVHDRALATGQSFEEMAEKVLTGIGAKSPKAFRDLQISSDELNESVKKNGSFIDGFLAIAEKHLKEAPILMDKTRLATEQTAKAWEDLKLQIGEAINRQTLFSNSIQLVADGLKAHISLEEQINDIQESNLTSEQKSQLISKLKAEDNEKTAKSKEKELVIQNQIKQSLEDSNPLKYASEIEDQNIRLRVTIGLRDYYNSLIKKVIPDVENIKSIEEKIKQLREDQQTALGNELTKINQQIQALQKKEELLKNQGKVLPREQQSNTPGQFNLDTSVTAKAGEAATHLEKAYADMAKNINRDLGIIKPAFVSLADQNKSSMDKMKQEAQDLIDIHNQMATSIGSSIGQAIGHYQNLAQGLAQATVGIVNELEKQALAAIIADAAKTGGNPVVAVALAAAGFAAIKSLFSQIGGATSGGGGGSIGGSSYAGLNRSGINLNPQTVHVVGTMSGRDVVFTYDKNKNLDSQRKGG